MALRIAVGPESGAAQGFALSATGLRPDRSEIFFQEMERSVQIRESGQPPVSPVLSPESDIERLLKNKGKKADIPDLRASPVQAPSFPVISTVAPGFIRAEQAAHLFSVISTGAAPAA